MMRMSRKRCCSVMTGSLGAVNGRTISERDREWPMCEERVGSLSASGIVKGRSFGGDRWKRSLDGKGLSGEAGLETGNLGLNSLQSMSDWKEV